MRHSSVQPDLPRAGCLDRHPRWVALLLFLAVAAAFLPALWNDFVSFDDGTYVTLNPRVQSGLSWGGVAWAFRSSEASNWHPLTWLSHMTDCQLFGLRPWGHHLTNVLLHAVNTVLLYLALRRMTRATGLSLLVAALWGLHPLRVESVAWVAERKDVLSAGFFFLTVLAYARYATAAEDAPAAVRPREPRSPRFSHHWRWYGMSLVAFALGLLSKPMLVTLPFVLLLLDFWPLGRFERRGLRLVTEKAPFLLLAAASSVVTFLVQNNAGATMLLGHLSLRARVENALVSYARYLGKLFWPADLAVFYPHPGTWPLAAVCLAGLLVGGICGAAWFLRRRHPYWLTGWCWFLGTLVPVIGIVQVGRQAIADRYTYLPLVGVLILLVWSAEALGRRIRLPAFAVPIGTAVLLVLCAGLTLRQIATWKNSETLFRHAIAAVPDNYLAHGNLGNIFERDGRLAEAFREYDEVLRLRPDDVNTRNGLGSLLLNLGRFEEAISQFEIAIRQFPEFAEAHNNLGYVYQRQGRNDQAAMEYRKALALNPRDFRVHLNLAAVLLAQGNPFEAIRQLQAAVELKPDDAGTRNDLGGLLFNAGRIDEATRQLEAAVRLAPNFPEAHYNLGAALAAKGNPIEAARHLLLALKLRPNYPEARRRLETLSHPQDPTPAPTPAPP